ncbi:lipocalin family protein [Flavobacterium sp. ALJ2]|uniref:lipocalin family protein n=1 Tax=Flavobacterium sp. ALJ2 TaxID=2786960 RepID=UPI00189DBD1B|nr:lipocalin family protein [Flavobacterium sp. ALJ2]MBF7092929.1 lipocalin family protein [Flavobacterium sp. ALJ2]
MKKNCILFLFVATLGLSISSCSNDNEASIEATWEITHEGEIDKDGKEILTPVSDEGNCAKTTITFSAGGIFSGSYSEYNNSKCQTFSDKGVWSKSGNTLTIKYEGETEGDSGEILELSDSTLKLKYTETNEDKVVEIYVVVYKRK